MSRPFIQLENVDVSIDGSRILHGVNWSIARGESWTVVGPNGCGKSTLLRLLRGDLWPEPTRGRRIYWLNGIPQESPVGIRERVATVSPEQQERYQLQDWNLTAWEAVLTGFAQTDLLYERLSAAQLARARELFRFARIDDLRRRPILTLSTGELRKVLIARALVGNPLMLILDEFSDGLDAASRHSISRLISAIQAAGVQVICSTHRPEEILAAAHPILHLEAGRVVRGARGNRGLAAGHIKMVEAPAGDSHSKFLVRVHNADVYREGRRALHQVSWQIGPGEHWAVLGSNGSGKSTLLKLIASQLYPAWGGTIEWFNGTKFSDVWELKRRIGYVSPDLQTFHDRDLLGREVVASGFFSSVGLPSHLTPVQRQRTDELFRKFGAESLAAKQLSQMSFGQVRKLLLLRALVHSPEMLVLDEPFDGLDMENRQVIRHVLDQVAREGATLVIVTHHPGELPACVTRALALEKGRRSGVFRIDRDSHGKKTLA